MANYLRWLGYLRIVNYVSRVSAACPWLRDTDPTLLLPLITQPIITVTQDPYYIYISTYLLIYVSTCILTKLQGFITEDVELRNPSHDHIFYHLILDEAWLLPGSIE